jgi:hypothetical protein
VERAAVRRAADRGGPQHAVRIDEQQLAPVACPHGLRPAARGDHLAVRPPVDPPDAWTGLSTLPGTWDVTLTVRNCTTGAPLATIQELATFDGAGTVTSSTSAPMFPPATKTPGHAVWRRLSLRAYSYSFKFFRFDAAGVFLGWTVIRQRAVLSPHGNECTSQGGAEVYNTAGILIATGCSTSTATRFQ